MREWLVIISEPAITLIDALALLVILVGTIEVSVKVARAIFKPLGAQLERQVWLRYARWLVAGLTFQLAADIIETSISTSWQTIGRVGRLRAGSNRDPSATRTFGPRGPCTFLLV